MGIDYIKSYGDLQQELDDAKDNLVALNDNIRRIVGRNSKELRNDKLKNDNDRQTKTNDVSKVKRRSYDSKSVFHRLSAPASRSLTDEEHRPRINSRVIRELPTRQQILAAQGIDSESRARNRRMFGSLMGTLHKFCQEESKLKPKEDKKAQIEKKLEEQELQERKTLKKERELLFMDRKRKQLEIKKLELKMSRLKDFEAWENSTNKLKYHIRTKTKPYIYFKPRVMCKKTEKLFLESQTATESMIEKRKENLNKELTDLENSLKVPEYDMDESLDNSNNYNTKDALKTPRVKDEPSDVPDSNSKKGDFDFKENKSRNLNEPVLSSSIVVVKNIPKDSNKII